MCIEVKNMKDYTYQLAPDIYWVGVNDDTLHNFDITYFTEKGSTYNAYLVKGSLKSAIIDTAKANFADEFLEKVESIIDLKEVDYLVLNHTEPDHSGSVSKILEINPNITVISSGPGLSNLKEIVNVPFTNIRATNDLRIDLGNKTLSFYIQPNLHWPDTMFTYVKEDSALFSCDFFGAHYSYYGVVSANMQNKDEYIASMKYYFDCLFSPFKKDVNRALDLIDTLDIAFVGTSHGSVVDLTFLADAKRVYREWAKLPEPKEQPLVIIPYTSVYGYTRKMVPAIEEGIKEAFNGKVIVEIYDLVIDSPEKVIERIHEADAFILGSTTILGDAVKPAWDLLTLLNPYHHGIKFAAAFGSYGWSGEAVKFLTERMNQLKMKTMDGLRIRFNPSLNQLEDSKAFGVRFGKFIQGIE